MDHGRGSLQLHSVLEKDGIDGLAQSAAFKVFNIGAQKTGTTSISIMLGEHLATRCCHYLCPGPWHDESRQHVVNKTLATHRCFSDNGDYADFRWLDAKFPQARFIMTVRNETAWKVSLFNHIKLARVQAGCTPKGNRESCARGSFVDNSDEFFAWRVKALHQSTRSALQYFAESDERRQRFLVADMQEDELQLCRCIQWLLRPDLGQYRVLRIASCPPRALADSSLDLGADLALALSAARPASFLSAHEKRACNMRKQHFSWTASGPTHPPTSPRYRYTVSSPPPSWPAGHGMNAIINASTHRGAGHLADTVAAYYAARRELEGSSFEYPAGLAEFYSKLSPAQWAMCSPANRQRKLCPLNLLDFWSATCGLTRGSGGPSFANHSFATVYPSRHRWCALARDNWLCAGDTYGQRLQATLPFDARSASLLNAERPLRIYAEGNSHLGELIAALICEDASQAWRLQPCGNSFAALFPRDSSLFSLSNDILVADGAFPWPQHVPWSLEQVQAARLRVIDAFRPNVLLIGNVN